MSFMQNMQIGKMMMMVLFLFFHFQDIQIQSNLLI